MNRFLGVAQEAIVNLTLKLSPRDLHNFFIAYPEFKYLLTENYYLILLSDAHKVPIIINLDDLSEYSSMKLNNRLYEVAKLNDMYNVKRMIKFGADVNDVAKIALHSENFNVFDLMIDLGANHFGRFYEILLLNGYYDQAEKFREFYDEYKRIIEVMNNAAKTGDIDTVEKMLEFNIEDKYINEAINNAIDNHHLDIVERLIKLTTSINDIMYHAAVVRNMDVIKRLIELDIKNIDLNRLIECAIYVNYFDLVKLLLKSDVNHMIDLNEASNSAANNGDLDIFNLVVMYNLEHINFNSIIYYAAKKPIILKRLIELGAYDYVKILYYAAKNGYISIINEIIENYPYRILHVNDAIVAASSSGYLDIVNLLIKVEESDECVKTVGLSLIEAAVNDHLNVVNRMLEFDIEKEYINEAAYKIITKENYKGYEILELLLKKGALENVNMKDIFPSVVKLNNINVIRLLLQYLSNNNTIDLNRAMNIAAENRNIDMVRLLLHPRADFETKFYGATSINSTMNIASRKGSLDIVKMMVEAGGTNFVNSITSAKQCNNQDIVDYLNEFV